MWRADSSNTLPDRCAESPSPFGARFGGSILTVTPCCTSRFAIVVTSARSGRLARISGSAVNRLAAISGNDAFLAPPMLIVPVSCTPPRIRILSIVLAPGGYERPAAQYAYDRNTVLGRTVAFKRDPAAAQAGGLSPRPLPSVRS